MQNKKQAFSFVEIIITVSIITLLAVIGLSYQNSYKDKTYNSRVISHTYTINNALESYFEENKTLPMP